MRTPQRTSNNPRHHFGRRQTGAFIVPIATFLLAVVSFAAFIFNDRPENTSDERNHTGNPTLAIGSTLTLITATISLFKGIIEPAIWRRYNDRSDHDTSAFILTSLLNLSRFTALIFSVIEIITAEDLFLFIGVFIMMLQSVCEIAYQNDTPDRQSTNHNDVEAINSHNANNETNPDDSNHNEDIDLPRFAT